LPAQPQPALDAAPSLAMLAHLAPAHTYGNGTLQRCSTRRSRAQTPIAPPAALAGISMQATTT
jgi:hypothetical protein